VLVCRHDSPSLTLHHVMRLVVGFLLGVLGLVASLLCAWCLLEVSFLSGVECAVLYAIVYDVSVLGLGDA